MDILTNKELRKWDSIIPNKVRVIDILNLIGQLKHTNIVDGSSDNILIDYFTSAFKGRFDQISDELLSKEVTQLFYNSDERTYIINVGEEFYYG